MGIIIAILILGFLIASHEFGHLLMAKLFKIGVPEYSLGEAVWKENRRYGLQSSVDTAGRFLCAGGRG